MRRLRRQIVMFAAGLWVGFSSLDACQADEITAADWYRYYLNRASEDYELTATRDESKLTLVRTPFLNWTNPLEAGQINGSSFVWELNGRPVAIGQFFSYLAGQGRRSYCHVFTTLSDKPLAAKFQGELFWQPVLNAKTGWRSDHGAGFAAGTPTARLLQMRNLARQFSTYTEEKTRGRRNLRLLPQPVYRYRQQSSDLDGGLFAYVVGNDPELMILIECDLTSENPKWRYRFAQSTKSTTVAMRKGDEVYRFARPETDSGDPESMYLSRHGVENIPNDPKLPPRE